MAHMGAINSGHYYSFIRDPASHSSVGSPGETKEKQTGSRWSEFNDSRVSVFDPAQIPAECFGVRSPTSSPDLSQLNADFPPNP